LETYYSSGISDAEHPNPSVFDDVSGSGEVSSRDYMVDFTQLRLEQDGDCFQVYQANQLRDFWNCPELETLSNNATEPDLSPTLQPVVVDPPLPVDTNLVANFNFANGLDGWSSDFSLTRTVENGMLILQYESAPAGWFGQEIDGYTIEAESPLIVWLRVSNPHSIGKTFALKVSDIVTSHSFNCIFRVEPDTVDLVYAMRFRTQSDWDGFVVQFRPEDTDRLIFDNVNLRYRPELQFEGIKTCLPPTTE
jgi:hypothetical protein